MTKTVVKPNEDRKMGAKAPEKLKLRRTPVKCDVCGRKFHNVQALASHRKFAHKPKSLPAKRLRFKKQTDAKEEKVVKKKVSNAPVAKTKAEIPSPKVAPKTNSVKKVANEVTAKKEAFVARKIEFRCPKCVKVFSVYFSAFRHIQKNHCVDINDGAVEPNSPDLIKPIRIELCVSCNEWTEGTDTHNCKNDNTNADRYMCLGCQKTFDNLTLFEQHVKELHATGAESLFFPSNPEFISWKTDLESVTKTKFVTLTIKQKVRKIYHCSHQPLLRTDKALLCPASLSVTEFKSGYQVFYYKEHFGHSCVDISSHKYKKYSINPFLKDTEDNKSSDREDNIYQNFKNIMESITTNAANVDIGVLNTLLGKALEMTFVLNGTVHDDKTVVNKSMSDEQITEVLSEVKTYAGKRKGEAIKKDIKKLKPVVENDENTKTDSLVNKNVIKKTELLPPIPIPTPLIQSPTFNDTYKDFIGQNLMPLDTNTPKKNVFKKKVVMKTKIGQFKVKSSLSPKDGQKRTPVKESMLKIIPDVKYEVKEQENDCNILILKI